MAYLDQLSRSQALPGARIAALQKAIGIAENSHSQSKLAQLSGMAASLKVSATRAKTPADSKRMRALADILKHPSR
jgi:hypothetical protein